MFIYIHNSISETITTVAVYGEPAFSGDSGPATALNRRQGVSGQSIWVRSFDRQGRQYDDVSFQQADSLERIRVKVGTEPGLYYVRVGTSSQYYTVKIIRQ
ncbi:hypothetical protein [Spirosoma fluminis]